MISSANGLWLAYVFSNRTVCEMLGLEGRAGGGGGGADNMGRERGGGSAGGTVRESGGYGRT